MPVPYRGRVIATLSDVPLRGRRVLVRLDLNSPVDPDTGRILSDHRIRAAASSVKRLVEEGAAVVAMSHQGRPLESDFTGLEAHAEELARLSGVNVSFVDDVIGPEAIRRIKSVSPGEVLLLQNTRLVSEDYIEAPPEVHARSFMVRRLAPLFDLYVNDAFSVSHRSQASVVGFPLVIPGVAGPLTERELDALDRALERSGRPIVVFLGGAKLKDAISIMEALGSGAADEILTGGLVGLMVLAAMGKRVPGPVAEVIERKAGEGWRQRIVRLLDSGAPVRAPKDFRSEVDGDVVVVPSDNIVGAPKDIGPATVEEYSKVIEGARAVVMRGPAGVIEDERFRWGTVKLVEAALRSRAYTLLGGGHFNAVLSELPEELRARVGHVSTAGGALLYFLAGRPLPGLEALALSAEKFGLAG